MKKQQIAASLILSLTPLLCPMFLPCGHELSQPTEAAWYDNENTFLDRGKQAYNQGQFDQAIQALTESIKLNGDRADSYYWRGLALLAIMQNDRALADLNDAIRLAPDSTSVSAVVCFIQTWVSLTRLLPIFDKALAIDPNLIMPRLI
jgi:tetratricopeptide (TPR) repeat protein